MAKWRLPWKRDVEDQTRLGGWSSGTGLSMMQSLRDSMDSGTDLGTDVIYSAVTRISGALSAMPVRLYKGTREATDERLYWLVRLRPNRRMSASTFFKALLGWVLTEGRGYAAQILDDSGRVQELEILDPRSVTPMREEKTDELWYKIIRTDGRTEYIHSGYVLAFHHMTLDGITSRRPIDVLRGALQYATDIRTFSLEAAKAVNRGIVLEYPTTLSGMNRERSVAEFLALYKKTGGQIIALDSGVKAHRMDASPIDAGLEGTEKLTRSRAATVYNLPPHLLGDYSDATAASIEQQNIEFLTMTMLPIVQQLEQELDYKLLTPEQLSDGWHFRVDMDAYLRGDSSAMATMDQSSIRTGKRTVNELRLRDYLPPVDGGDMAMISKDLAPVSLVAAGATIDADQLNGEKNT